jgi:predicted nucleic acid-binding protein
MVKALFDTNILIDFLNGIEAARTEIALYQDRAISAITWMEVQVGTQPQEQHEVDLFLAGFTVLPIDAAVSKQAVVLRKGQSIKLPDAIIWATAQVHHRLLVTRNSKDFAPAHPGVRTPYVL